MYKLLLVDDESIIREGIQAMIDWESLNITLTAACGDALSALNSMMDDMPDILLTDMRMPGVDGLGLIERAMSLHPQLQTVILSGYNEFDYARQAMKYGVKEYLLKPCSKEEIEEALVRTCSHIDRIRRRVLQLTGERENRVRQLVEKLNELQESAIDNAALKHQVGELAKTVQDPIMLREALFRIITSSAQAQWGFSVIQDALSSTQDITGLIFSTLLRLRSEAGGDVRNFVQKMVAYIGEHYSDETLSLQYMADNVVYMSADYIGREFARCMGQRFSAYLLKVRMEHAKNMMAADPDMRSYEIAEQIGLGNNPHYFSQVFRKYTGLTTKEYRTKIVKMTEK